MAPRTPTDTELFFYATLLGERDVVEKELCEVYRVDVSELKDMAVRAMNSRLKTYGPSFDELYQVATKQLGEEDMQRLLAQHGITADRLDCIVHEFLCYIKLRLKPGCEDLIVEA